MKTKDKKSAGNITFSMQTDQRANLVFLIIFLATPNICKYFSIQEWETLLAFLKSIPAIHILVPRRLQFRRTVLAMTNWYLVTRDLFRHMFWCQQFVFSEIMLFNWNYKRFIHVIGR